jgi:cell wall-associated NlpC family hydrolase
MECHKPGHGAPARCASALLAATALLATAADELAGQPSKPALGLAAVETPQSPPDQPDKPDTPDKPGQAGQPSRADQAAQASRPTQTVSTVSTVSAVSAVSAKPTAPQRPAAKKAAPKKAPPKKASAKKAISKKAMTKKVVPKRASPPRKATRHSKPATRHTKPASPLTHLPPPANPKAAKAVHEAMSLMGVPYRWGGTSRAGFDCSGFTQHVWAAAGVKIPRTVRQQADAGTPVPLNKAQPGDLVVFYPGRQHVGLFIGNGLVVDSPHTGSFVRTDPIRSMPVSLVVRPT